MVASRLRIYPRYVVGDTYKSAFSVKVRNRTDAVFSNVSGLSHTDVGISMVVQKDYVYILASDCLSVYDRITNTRVSLVRTPEIQLVFNCLAVNKAQVYIGTSDGVYVIAKNGLLRDSPESYFNLKFSYVYLGGKNVKHIACNTVSGSEYLAVSHENGMTLITNDGQYVSYLSAADSNPGDLIVTSKGQIYYGNGTNGLYFINSPNNSGSIYLSIPFEDYLYSSLPSKIVKDISVSEDSVSGFKNTIFVATASGVSIITEDTVLNSLSSIRNISISNITGIFTSEGATTDSGYLYYCTNNSSTGVFVKYNLSTDSIEESYNTSSDSIVSSNEFTFISKI